MNLHINPIPSDYEDSLAPVYVHAFHILSVIENIHARKI